MIEKFVTKSGHKSILINDIRYHSSYNPEKEADRFITNIIGDTRPSTVIISGAGIGYLITAVRKQFPEAKVVILFYRKELFDLCSTMNTLKNNYCWHPDLNIDIHTFLHTSLSDLDIEGLQMIEWPVSASLFPEISKLVQKNLSQVIKEKRGSIVSSIAMGRLWIRNSFINFIHLEDVYRGNSPPASCPVILTASGPTLEESIHLIKKWENKALIISLPSAVKCLLAYSIKPDIIVMTDPGYYSMHHLKWADISHSVIYMPLSAATGIWKTDAKVILFSQPNFFEILLLSKCSNIFHSIPPKGTVAATALEIAQKLSKSEIFIAGLDLCFQDIRSHAMPHSFHTLLEITASRLSPVYSQEFRRSIFFAPEYNSDNKTRTSLALKTYEGWFRSFSPASQNKLIRLYPSPVAFPSISSMEKKEFNKYFLSRKSIEKKSFIQRLGKYPGKKERQNISKDILKTWNKNIMENIKIIKNTNTLISFINNMMLLKLLYFTNLQDLCHIKRIIRLNGEKACIEPVLDMLNDSAMFVQRLYNNINNFQENTERE